LHIHLRRLLGGRLLVRVFWVLLPLLVVGVLLRVLLLWLLRIVRLLRLVLLLLVLLLLVLLLLLWLLLWLLRLVLLLLYAGCIERGGGCVRQVPALELRCAACSSGQWQAVE